MTNGKLVQLGIVRYIEKLTANQYRFIFSQKMRKSNFMLTIFFYLKQYFKTK